MPNNFNKANIKAFMNRVFTPRNIVIGGMGAVVVFLLWRDLNDDSRCDANQSGQYKKELAAARDSLSSLQFQNDKLKFALDDCNGGAILRDSILVLNQKLDDCRGKKKIAVKPSAKSAAVKRVTAKSTTSVSLSAKQSSSKSGALINFYDSSSNKEGGIVINVYTTEDGQKKIIESVARTHVQSSINTQKADTLVLGAARVSVASRGRKVLITEIVSTEETRTR